MHRMLSVFVVVFALAVSSVLWGHRSKLVGLLVDHDSMREEPEINLPKLILVPARSKLMLPYMRQVDSLNCHTCVSYGNDTCKLGPKKTKGKLPSVECSREEIERMNTEVTRNTFLKDISNALYVNVPNYGQAHVPKMACGKLDLQVSGYKMTIRSCQLAKTPSYDPCAEVRSKISKSAVGAFNSVKYCGLCVKKLCNGAITSSPKILYILLPLFGTIALGGTR